VLGDFLLQVARGEEGQGVTLSASSDAVKLRGDDEVLGCLA
jgi:hypothetical protein